MPDVVTFDPARRLIIEIPAGSPEDPTLDNNIDVIEIYSEWKVWAQQNGEFGESPEEPNMRFPPAMRVVGGDPISDVQNLGSTFFLINGWRIKPAEGSHRLTLTGNLFTDPAGESTVVPTDGVFTVLVENFVSNLVDSSVSRLDLTQLLPAVYMDDVNGIAGTDEGIGTPTNPVNNIADAFTIANRDNLSEFRMRGTFTLDRAAPSWTFTGLGSEKATTLDLAGFDVDESIFTEMVLTGSHLGSIEAEKCGLSLISNLAGIFRRCGLISDFSLQASGSTIFESCFSEVAGDVTPMCDFNGASDVQFRNYSGGIEIENMTSGNASIDLDPGHLILGGSNTGGTLLIRGQGRFTKNGSPGPQTTIIDGGFHDHVEQYIAQQVQGGNIDISADNQTITVYSDKTSPITVIRTFSLTPDGRIRRITS